MRGAHDRRGTAATQFPPEFPVLHSTADGLPARFLCEPSRKWTHWQGHLRFTHLPADGGYDSKANNCWLREDLGLESIIPPVTGWLSRHVTSRPDRRQLQPAFPYTIYGQRWKAETLISVSKRRFGGAITARRYRQQVKQTLLPGVTYNLDQAVKLGLSAHLRCHRLVKATA
jgi:hypothetical protein